MNILDYKLTIKSSSITEREKEIFSKKLIMLQNKDSRFIYRGENKSKLFKLYNCSDFASFSHSLFLIGNKGRGFIENVSRSSIGKKKWRLNDIENEIFEDLFKIINVILKKPDDVVLCFSLNNKVLSDYFKNIKNVFSFKFNVSQLTKVEKVKVRDYYLTLIHQFEDECFYPISSLLSVTTDYAVADGFSGENKEKIVLFGWLPFNRKSDKYEITYDYLNLTKKILSENNLPAYSNSFYPSEKEISLKGGILPNYIIGYLYSDRDSEIFFDINPNFMSLKDNSKFWIEDGLPIDQSGFWHELKKTNFQGSFWVNCNGEYWNDDKL